MRIRALIIFVIIYILSAFAFLTYSLLHSSDNEFTLKNQTLRAGLNACTLRIIQQSKNQQLGNDSTEGYYLKQLKLQLHQEKLKQLLKKEFNNDYIFTTKPLGDRQLIQLAINPSTLQQLEKDRTRQRNVWLYLAILLLLLVGLGIYGVYYTIESIYKLNKRQNNFLLSVTHEFKTPIAAIRLMLQTSKNPKVNDEKRVELVDNSIQNTYRLEELAENMLTAMQIENNKYQYEKMQMDLTALIEHIAQNQSIKGELTAQIQPDVSVVADQFILRMAVNNLIENAFKYSDNKPIKLILEQNKKNTSIVVKDQGIGIEKSDYKNVFKKFYRIQDDETRTTKGTGLGLFIVKQGIENHQGKITISANKPHGSVFTITIPNGF